MAHKGTSDNKKKKYAAHAPIAAANKQRRMKKHLKNHPNDHQTAAKIN